MNHSQTIINLEYLYPTFYINPYIKHRTFLIIEVISFKSLCRLSDSSFINFSLKASRNLFNLITFITYGIPNYKLSSPADLNRSHAGWVHYSYYNKNLTVVKQLSSLGIYLHLNTLKYTFIRTGTEIIQVSAAMYFERV